MHSIQKKHRTDILIREQFNVLANLERQIKSNGKFLSTNQSFKEALENDSMNNLKTKIILVADIAKDLTASQSDDEFNNLLKLYRFNLVRCEVIRKLSVELDYARHVLVKSIKTQKKLLTARNRVDWLENEIEQLILSNKNIVFPMQKRLENDSNLKIEKEHLIEPPEESIEQAKKSNTTGFGSEPVEGQEANNDQTPRNDDKLNDNEDEILKLDFKWDKKSTGSTNSLFESDLEENMENASEVNLKQEEKIDDVFENRDSSEKHEDEDQLRPNEEETFAFQANKSEHGSEKSDDELELTTQTQNKIRTPSENTQLPDNLPNITGRSFSQLSSKSKNLNSNNTERKLEVDQPGYKSDAGLEETYPVWQKIHNRYEIPLYSKKLVSIDPTSYHRLGLARTESYFSTDDSVDGRLNIIEKKSTIDLEDAEFLKFANHIKTISETVYKDSYDFAHEKTIDFRKSENTSTSQNDSLEIIEINRSRAASAHQKLSNYSPPVLLPITPKPLSKTRIRYNYPRTSSAFRSDSNLDEKLKDYRPCLPINQHDLKEQTRLKLYHARRGKTLIGNEFNLTDKQKRDESRIPPLLSWNDVKPDSSPIFHSGLKFERVKSLLSVNLKSMCFEEKRDAIKHIGLLKASDSAAVYSLKNIIENEHENEIIRFEAVKSLILLGDWCNSVCELLNKYLFSENKYIKQEIFNSIINSKNPQYSDISNNAVKSLIETIEGFIGDKDEKFSLDACICIGKIGIKDSQRAIGKLVSIANHSTVWNHKIIALEAIVKLFDVKTSKILKMIMVQLHTCPEWLGRCSAARLLSYIGPSIINHNRHAESVYRLLEMRLSDDPIQEVRSNIGQTIKDLKIFQRTFLKITKNLESLDETCRAKAVISIEMLGIKKNKTIQKLIDMLELDTSEYVRTLVLKALIYLAPQNQKVIQALNSLEKNSKIYEIMQKIKEKNQ